MAGTDEVVRVGDIVKYLNICLQISSRNTADGKTNGWVEWALVMVKQSETSMPITNVGTLTVGCIAANMYRNESIYSGCLPVGDNTPNAVDLKFKVPKAKQKIRLGDHWRFYYYYRSNDSTDVTQDNIRSVASVMFKSYS